eukprot:EG_transcript_14100
MRSILGATIPHVPSHESHAPDKEVTTRFLFHICVQQFTCLGSPELQCSNPKESRQSPTIAPKLIFLIGQECVDGSNYDGVCQCHNISMKTPGGVIDRANTSPHLERQLAGCGRGISACRPNSAAKFSKQLFSRPWFFPSFFHPHLSAAMIPSFPVACFGCCWRFR